MRQEASILTPSQVGQYIKGFMDRDRLLSGLLVRGELSNYKMYPSGHHYFTLKDREGALRCVMFRGDAASLRFRPQNGMQVIAAGRVTVFPRDGQYQMYCVRLTPEGAGDLFVAFEQLKERLLRQGLFAQEHKKPLPRMPGRIALVTSPAGAAVRDMLRILGARWPMAQVRILPVRVQGEGAAEEIAAAIRWANLHQVADLIITGRGGGSMEDLWAFNEEVVARAIFDSRIPVVSAVGHEPDVTISDYVADCRAATPSHAAEIVVPDQMELRRKLRTLSVRLAQSQQHTIDIYTRRLRQMQEKRVLTDPMAFLQDRAVQLDYTRERLASALERILEKHTRRFTHAAASLDAMSPLRVLSRGYCVAQKQEGTVLRSSDQVEIGETIALRLARGGLECTVTKRGEEP